MGTLGKAECRGIAARSHRRAQGDVDTKPGRSREFGEERQQDAAGAGAEIEKTRAVPRDREPRRNTASTTVSVSGRGSSVSGDRPNSRPQNSRRPRMRLNGSRSAIRSNASRTRSVCCSSSTCSGWPRSSAGVRSRAEATNRRAGGEARRIRLATASRRPRRATSRASPSPRAQPSTVANRAAWSSARIASMISSSASPLITLSIL